MHLNKESVAYARLRQKLLVNRNESRGLFIGKSPPPPREYQPMSFGEKLWKGEEKQGKMQAKKEEGKKKKKKGNRKIKGKEEKVKVKIRSKRVH